ncbi:MAG: DICT sensory domain-containing protein [Leptolyngbyaceae cyanobacterium bins.59]|nr:DICT sensory domain-containing protein [Leptolyngbyaceae cyanobacterium bins.59]
MNSVSPQQDSSLYELALNASPLASPLQISPATLRSLFSTLMETLIDHQIPATIWAKLPRGKIWRTEINRYLEAIGLPTAIYLFSNPGDDLLEEMGHEPLALKEEEENPTEGSFDPLRLATPPLETALLNPDSLLVGSGTSLSVSDSELSPPDSDPLPSGVTDSQIYSIGLASESQLKREYFLLVVSPQLSGLVIAHRPRSVRSAKSEDTPTSNRSEMSGGEEDFTERKHPLLALCSFDKTTLQQALEGVQQAILFNQSRTLQNAEGDLAIDWEPLLTQCMGYHPDPGLMTTLFSKQVHHQEELWHRVVNYRRQAEQVDSFQAQIEELQESIRSRDEFLKNVGQELRTPLTNMKTALSLLNSPQIRPAQRQRYMQLLSTECDRQSSLITSLLDLVQLEHAAENTTMQPISVAEVLPGVVSTYQPLAQEKGIMLAYTIPEGLPPVVCLHPWLKQITINLLHNGIKFTPTGGQVWVRAKVQGDYLQLEFRDTGIGIPPHELPKIFDRFYRVRHAEDYGGAGLGLSLVQQILLRSGGSISVKSKLGEGSTFNVLIPIYRGTTDG